MPANTSKSPGTSQRSKASTQVAHDPMRPALSIVPASEAPSAAIGYVRADSVRLQRVQCPLEGYKHIWVTYRTNNAFWVADELAKFVLHPEDEESRKQLCDLVCAFVRKIDGFMFLDSNDKPVPTPAPGEYTSWFFVMTELDDLWRWIVRDGYTAAKEQAVKNS